MPVIPDIPPWLISGAERWASDPSIVIAVLSLVLSTAISAKALKAANRASPDIRGEFDVWFKADDVPDDIPPILMNIAVWNRGMAPVFVKSFEVYDGDSQGHFRWKFDLGDHAELVDGPKLPVKVDGAKVFWQYGFRELKNYRDRKITDPDEIYREMMCPVLRVELGNGTYATLTNRTGSRLLFTFLAIRAAIRKRRKRALRASEPSESASPQEADPTVPPAQESASSRLPGIDRTTEVASEGS